MTIAVSGLITVSQAVARIVEDNLKAVNTCFEIEAAFNEQAESIELIATDGRASARTQFESSLSELQQKLGVLESMVDEGEEDDLFLTLREKLLDYLPHAMAFVRSNELTQQPSALRTVRDHLRPEIREMRDTVTRLRILNETDIEGANAIAQQSAQEAVWRAAVVATVSLLLGILLTRRMTRQALTPLTILSQQAELIGSGDLSQKVRLGAPDEIEALVGSFNEMAAKLWDMRKSEVRRLHRAQRMSDAALENLYDPVIVTDGKARIVHLNRAAQGVFGPVDESHRVPVEEHIHDRRIVTAIQNAVGQEKVLAAEDESAMVRIKIGDGERTYRLRATPMKDEEVGLLGAVAVLEDITHLKQVERLKNEFIGVASHELRTPVTSMVLSNQLLEEGALGELNPGQLEVIRAQRQDLQRLESLMRDLLDVTRLEAGAMPPRLAPIQPGDLLRSVVNGQRLQADDKGVALEFEMPTELSPVRADRGQIGRVLNNLVANAIRHTPPHGKVTVRAMESGNVVTFEVEDTGEGIPADYRERIFERFVQVPGATQGGAGLGLSISRAIVRAHGGEMSVESEVGKGSIFRFTLVRHAAPVEEHQ